MAIHIMINKNLTRSRPSEILDEQNKHAFTAAHYFEMRDLGTPDAKRCLKLVEQGNPKAARALYEKITSPVILAVAKRAKIFTVAPTAMDKLIARAIKTTYGPNSKEAQL